jgi:hypothetical protein
MTESNPSVVIPYNKKAGRPKKEKGEAKFDKKEYMRNYMKIYKAKNKDTQLARRNTSYYISKYNIDQEFVNKYGIYTAQVYKTMEDIKKIKKECPSFIKDINEFIKNIIKEDEEKQNHVADLSGVEVLTEIE